MTKMVNCSLSKTLYRPNSLKLCSQQLWAKRTFDSHQNKYCTTCGARSGQKEVTKSRKQNKKLPRPRGSFNEESEQKWDFLNFAEYNRPWQVPWRKRETALGFFGWILTFLLVSLLTIPGIVQITGKSLEEFSSQEKVGFVVLNQILETGFGIWVVLFLLRNYRPLPEDIFFISVKDPVKKPDGWLVWGSVGFLMAPILVSTVLNVTTALGYTEEGASTVDEVVKIISPDFATFAGLFSVTSILAPVLEEFVFRGFLLASLTSFMPVPYAILGSSVAFGLAHLSLKDFPELTALGILLACSYIRSRNLMAPILIHSMWNGFVLIALFSLGQTPT